MISAEKTGQKLTDTTLAILAGGEGSRMGRPKGELRIAGKPILEYLLDRFDWPGPTMLVTAPGREHPPGFARFGREVVDPVFGEGPLRGILTAMENCTTKSLMVASVDMPLIERSHLAWLIERLGDFLGAMLSHEDKIEPLPIALSMNALHKIRDRLAKKQASLRALASIDGFRLISAPDDWPQAIWTNLNRPEDLDRLGR